MAENLSGLVDSEKVPLDLAMLPDVEVILKHMNGFGEVSYCDQDGVIYKARSLGGAVILGLLGRFLDKAPGIPPHVLERLGRRFASTMGQGPFGNRGSAVVNPLAPGVPRVAEQKIVVSKLTQAIDKDPKNGSLYYQRGHALHRIRQFDASATDFKRCFELGFRKPLSSYNIACNLSLLNQKDDSFKWLETALQVGFNNWDTILNDTDLDNIRTEPRFWALMRKHRSH